MDIVQYEPIEQLYGQIVGIYRRSGERGEKEGGVGKGGKREGEKGKKGSVRKPK